MCINLKELIVDTADLHLPWDVVSSMMVHLIWSTVHSGLSSFHLGVSSVHLKICPLSTLGSVLCLLRSVLFPLGCILRSLMSVLPTQIWMKLISTQICLISIKRSNWTLSIVLSHVRCSLLNLPSTQIFLMSTDRSVWTLTDPSGHCPLSSVRSAGLPGHCSLTGLSTLLCHACSLLTLRSVLYPLRSF